MSLLLVSLFACKEKEKPDPGVDWACTIAEGDDPDYARQLGCLADYEVLASEPADASIPGATSVKTVIDRVDDDALYFQNSKRYCIHWDFASEHLSGNGLPIVPEMGSFNTTEYYSPDRRFLLGALSYYEGPAKWVYEISPYDTADADMIAAAYRKIRDNVWIGDDLGFHPTSAAVEAVAEDLPDDVTIVSTDSLYEGVDYQPLNLGTSTGILTFHDADDVDGGYTPYREIVVLDAVPNDISIVAGIVTAEFQTPLAHINVLSVNRGTPNMGLRDAQEREELLALEGKWVELTVGAFDWSIREISEAEADAWWEANKPAPLVVQPMQLDETELRDVSDILDLDTVPLADAIAAAIPVYGAKATNYAALHDASQMGEPIPVQPGFAVPMYYYDQFMTDNGLWDRVDELMADPDWADPVQREEMLKDFKDELRSKPMRPEVVEAVIAKAAQMFPGESIRFRSSTNSEDLGDFTGAGLYDSETGDPTLVGDGEDTVEWAMKKVWAQVWNPRAYEEREYYSIVHLDVGMGLLVHANFPDEEANGVAITNNPFDTTGLEPAFYVNAQEGGEDVVAPEPGVFADAYLQYYYSPGQPIVYIQHSTLVDEGETVLTTAESYELAVALDAVHRFFQDAYGDRDWYAMDVEWKFDDKYTPGTPTVWIKQARPFPGWSSDTSIACITE
ncbi:MAG: PEP/pyruvate-binding domain-containing protein [Myxococcota bacterium]